MRWDETAWDGWIGFDGYPRFIRGLQMTKLAQILLYSTHILQHRITSLPRFLFWQDDTTSHEIFLTTSLGYTFRPFCLSRFPSTCRPIILLGLIWIRLGITKWQELYYKVGRVIGRHRHLFTLIFLLWRWFILFSHCHYSITPSLCFWVVYT